MQSKIIYIIIFLLLKFPLNAQVSEVLFWADSFSRAGNHAQAEEILDRYEATRILSKWQLDSLDLYRIEKLYLQKKYTEGLTILYAMEHENLPLQQEKKRELLAGIGYIGLGNYSMAESYLMNNPKDTFLQSSFLFWQTILYLRSGNLKMARMVIKSQQLDTLNRIVLDSLCNKYKHKLRNPRLAFYLNILPGLGFVYTGDARNAVNSLLLNGALMGFTIWQAQSAILLGSLLYTQWGFRYYIGGMNNAAKSAVYHNQKYLQKIEKKYKEILQIQRNKN